MTGLVPAMVAMVLLQACQGGGDSVGGAGVDTTVVPVPDPAGSAWVVAAARACREVVNGYRADSGLKALADWTDSVPCFQRQAALDMEAGKGHANFGMCGERAQNTCPGWGSDTTAAKAEATVRSCAASMWAEGPGADYAKHGHYINMSNTGYTRIGCGFRYRAGKLWINMDFR